MNVHIPELDTSNLYSLKFPAVSIQEFPEEVNGFCHSAVTIGTKSFFSESEQNEIKDKILSKYSPEARTILKATFFIRMDEKRISIKRLRRIALESGLPPIYARRFTIILGKHETTWGKVKGRAYVLLSVDGKSVLSPLKDNGKIFGWRQNLLPSEIAEIRDLVVAVGLTCLSCPYAYRPSKPILTCVRPRKILEKK